jgi:cyclopropane fatty-acyl-phospholipid synthase-like methyltransferase
MKTCINLLSYAGRHVQLSDLRRILDWGCGSGRLTPHLLIAFRKRTFMARTSIERRWNGRPPGTTRPSQRLPTAPPLAYDSSSFDLILAGSVFNHLTQQDQLSWLEEMRRLLTEEGLMIATTHGEFAGRFSFQDDFDQVLESGFSDERRDRVLDGIAPFDYYRATFQSKEHTMTTWGPILTVVDQIDAGCANFQDVFVLRKG